MSKTLQAALEDVRRRCGDLVGRMKKKAVSVEEEDWETDADYECAQLDRGGCLPLVAVRQERFYRAPAVSGQPRTCKVHVCTGRSCVQDGAHATLLELEELAEVANIGGCCTIAQFDCFGLCGRGPNVSIDWDDGSEEMETAVRDSRRMLNIVRRAATGRGRGIADVSLDRASAQHFVPVGISLQMDSKPPA